MFMLEEKNISGCSTTLPRDKKLCPQCRQKSQRVSSRTLESLLIGETKQRLNSLNGFYYCKTSTCKVIYFNKQNILFQRDLNTIVGLKDKANPAILCYCFNWTKDKIKENMLKNTDNSVLNDIKYSMSEMGCFCEIKNPSGTCCMGDISKFMKNLTL